MELSGVINQWCCGFETPTPTCSPNLTALGSYPLVRHHASWIAFSDTAGVPSLGALRAHDYEHFDWSPWLPLRKLRAAFYKALSQAIIVIAALVSGPLSHLSTRIRNMNSSKGAALVTGASQGLGKAIALRLARDGYPVAVNDISSKVEAVDALVAQISGDQGRAISILGDASSEEDVKAMIARTVAELGNLVVVSGTDICEMRRLKHV
jgi:hypothetical protein